MHGIGVVSRVRATLELVHEIKADRLPSLGQSINIQVFLPVLFQIIIQPVLTGLDTKDQIVVDPKMIFEVSNRYITTSDIREQECV